MLTSFIPSKKLYIIYWYIKLVLLNIIFFFIFIDTYYIIAGFYNIIIRSFFIIKYYLNCTCIFITQYIFYFEHVNILLIKTSFEENKIFYKSCSFKWSINLFLLTFKNCIIKNFSWCLFLVFILFWKYFEQFKYGIFNYNKL